jgi:hypothetical protein
MRALISVKSLPEHAPGQFANLRAPFDSLAQSFSILRTDSTLRHACGIDSDI